MAGKESDVTEAVQQSLTISSSFMNYIGTFDDMKTYPDVTIVIPGMENPLHLHRFVLSLVSKMFSSLFNGQTNPHCKFIAESFRVEWMEISETYRDVLVKWLRFCYGEDQTFSPEECPAALTVWFQLQLACKEDYGKLIKEYMVELSKTCDDNKTIVMRIF